MNGKSDSRNGRGIPALSLLLLVVIAHTALHADCLRCHGSKKLAITDSTGQVISLYVDSVVFQNSAHGSFDCEDCHVGAEQVPHIKPIPRVVCGSCHDDMARAYQWHGSHREVAGQLMPDCHDCHGTHDILEAANAQSQVNPVNLPKTCGHCHEDPAIVGKYHIPMTTPVEVFETSVHSHVVAGGGNLAATCVDCHSYQGTGHSILAPINPESPIYHFNIPRTCGKCHSQIQKEYEQGVHGQAAAKGEADTPVCTGCHSSHAILPVDDPHSRVNPVRVSMTTCAPCHEVDMLHRKYGLPTGILNSWLHSYHGLKSTDGDPRVANCSSCHQAHLILPQSDSLSSIAPHNIQKTCARCHPTITAELASIPIHGTPGVFLNPTGKALRGIYVVAIILIIGAMIVHWLIDLLKWIRMLNRGKQVVRMGRNELWQHTFLMVTFTVLAITGFAFHYSGAWWAKMLFGWEGGFAARRLIHRIAAGLFVATALWHMIYLLSLRGKQFFRDIFPQKDDFVQFFQTMAYDLGLRKELPRFGRFSYIEKAEYWALVWGTVVMTLTGFFLWFGTLTEEIFHVGGVGVMLVVHFYEAVLASLAILVWHMYSTIFNPPVYPNNPSWYTGKMPEEMYRHEHPDDPVFREPEPEEPSPDEGTPQESVE
jgi:cytochrome b subunit of formate dehydrogenase